MNVFGNLKKLIKEPKSEKITVKEPLELFKNLYNKYENTFLLESIEPDNGLSRYSIIGFDPVAIIKAHDYEITVKTKEFEHAFSTENPLMDLKELVNEQFNHKGFIGGLLGYISYESVKYIEDIATFKSIYPDFEFGLYLDCIIYDNINNTCEYVTFNEKRTDIIHEVNNENYSSGNLKYKLINEDMNQNEYEDSVNNIKNRINNGEIFQTVLSNPQNMELIGSKLPFYEQLREINPSPYMYHIKMNNREIIGSSPEMLMRLEGSTVETYPIAGTRSRGKSEYEDKLLEESLLNDEKELAEHLMLVDLARNDIGKVSKIGSVNVKEYFDIKKFSHVQHIVSHVTGEIEDKYDAIDAFMSVFPAGTLSGAPKIRAMEIINKEEKNARGPYGGAVGYFSLNGNADFAITIRTLTTYDNRAEIQAGAGIVYDSIATSEYEECKKKRQALIESLKLSASEVLE